VVSVAAKAERTECVVITARAAWEVRETKAAWPAQRTPHCPWPQQAQSGAPGHWQWCDTTADPLAAIGWTGSGDRVCWIPRSAGCPHQPQF
jgi:hypothetical protein